MFSPPGHSRVWPQATCRKATGRTSRKARGGAMLALALALAGCATRAKVDQVSFDRGAFALAYADLVTPMRLKCAASTLAPTPACAQLQVLDQQVRQAIIDAPRAAAAQPDPLSALLPLLLQLAPLAAGL